MGSHSIIEVIKSNEGERELRNIYRLYREEFLHLVYRKFGCDFDEGKEIFQETVIILYENIMSGKLTVLTSDLKTYLFGIGKNKALEKVRKRGLVVESMQVSEAHHNLSYDDPARDEEDEMNLERVVHALEQLGDPCKSILVQFYYHKKSMTRIAEMLEYKNGDSVKNMKYKCIQKLRSLFDKLPTNYNF